MALFLIEVRNGRLRISHLLVGQVDVHLMPPKPLRIVERGHFRE